MDDMRQALSVTLLAGALLPWPLARAQMHKVAKPEQVVRAVGVYEWVGDLKKPTGSRFIPVTVFINGALEDGGVYMARPIPFALTPGNEYELQQAGVPRGSLDLTDARHLQTANNDYEDGWLGYGTYKTPPPPRKEPALRASKTQPTIEGSRDDSRPHFSGNQPASDSKSSSDKDPQNSTDSQTKKSTGADDPDRPTMHRRDTSGTSTTDSTKASTSDPANDPDRPTLRRRSPEDAKKAKNNDIATVTGTGTSLNDDPDRPKLQHGAHSNAHDTDIPRLVGIPKDAQQMVAVSDPANRPTHDFARPWQDEKEHAAVLAQMQTLARTELAAYTTTHPAAPAPAAPTHTFPSTTHPTTAASARRARAAAAKSTPAPQQPLLDEQLRSYTLSYGGAPTYVYTAHTPGTGPDLRYVLVVAQADVNGTIQPALKSVTDEAHLDRTPRMRLVDVVDAEASNRASLLFELRAQNERQFALYRVIGARSESIFTTGTTQ